MSLNELYFLVVCPNVFIQFRAQMIDPPSCKIKAYLFLI